MINRFLDGFPILVVICLVMCCILMYIGLPMDVSIFLSILFWASIFNFIFIYIEMRLLKWIMQFKTLKIIMLLFSIIFLCFIYIATGIFLMHIFFFTYIPPSHYLKMFMPFLFITFTVRFVWVLLLEVVTWKH